ncbi:MAG TPA: ATP-dependent helicase HrpB [Ohtaekwangia sp.]|nr:ATP-dependent helicase HrpB [Ohtaekwangia sp.]
MEQVYPVLDILHELKQKLNTASVVILQAPPGAGKSTILPLELMGEPWLQAKKIVMLEPRRLAAKSVAERMAHVLGDRIGERIGYRVRFDSRVSRQTRIEVVTEGILTRMLQSDNSLEEVGLLIFDEFHERSIHADLALALSLQMQQVLRSDLRILIMSATFDSDQLAARLGNVPVVTSSGRQFPVKIHYAPHESDQPVPLRATAAIRKAFAEEQGDMLIFLPGSGEIKRVEELLFQSPVHAIVYPLYGDLSFEKQQEAILPRKDGMRKIVLATAIAETSLTIEGVQIVIDAGLARVPRFDPRSGLTRLDTIRVTRDAADQRAGRAGRLGPGTCYRLWTTGVQQALQDQRKPELLEADLAPLMLELAQWGVKDVNELTWITPPPAGAVNQARELLKQLDAINEQGITSRGREMLKLPTHPRIAHLLLDARDTPDLDIALATDVAALIEERDPLGREAGVDIVLRIEALRKWRSGEKGGGERNVLQRIEKLAANWRKLFDAREDNAIRHDTMAGRLLMAAYPERIAQQQGKHTERYKLANGRSAKLPMHDPLVREPLICVAQLDAGGGEGKIFQAAALDQKDLLSRTRESTAVKWDDERAMVIGVTEKRIGALVIESKPLKNIPSAERIDILLQVVQAKGLRLLGNEELRERFQARVLSLKAWRPGEAWPDVSDDALLLTLEDWLSPFLLDAAKQTDLERLDMNAMLNTLLPWELQQKLVVLAPTHLQVPSGSMIPVLYFKDARAPVMEVRLQEMFGLAETPDVNESRTKVLLHLLSPGYKPVQVTQDLRSFWETTYHEVRKELRVRYKKHHWPEDPWTAEAVRGAKRRNN